MAVQAARFSSGLPVPLSVDDKATMISSAVLPAALHACENTAIQDRHLQRLRTRITKALYGQKGKPNPFLVCGCLSVKNVDPEYFSLEKSLRTFLDTWHNKPSVGEKMLKTACQATNFKRTYDPCGTLQKRLGVIGWKCTENRAILTDMGIEFPISTTSFLDIRPHLTSSWGKAIHSAIANQKQYQHCKRPHKLRHAKVCEKLEIGMRKAIAPVMATAFQTEIIKSKYRPDALQKMWGAGCPHAPYLVMSKEGASWGSH